MLLENDEDKIRRKAYNVDNPALHAGLRCYSIHRQLRSGVELLRSSSRGRLSFLPRAALRLHGVIQIQDLRSCSRKAVIRIIKN